jgi:outer membrane biosynthesis protein TonB
MKWRKTMKSNGFELSTYSKAIQAEAVRVEGIEKDTANLRKELLANPSEELEEQIEDLENSIDEADNELVVRIKKYDANRERYSKLGDKLKDAREAKKQPKVEPQPEPAPEPTPEPEPIPDPIPMPQPEPFEEPKKKGSGGAILAIGLLVVGSIIGVNLLKKK